ncbi:MAG: leucine-rich repeat protein [Clostridia bacterium]|nr:leucine-rich repeat protein [Clostridia bacterium]MBR2907019.1 leucine-rich repeat protein [Clostridia bacterium]
MTKRHSTKRALLMSALSLLLCFSMLLGTTYAWFTDSVTSANNVIKSGNLDVALEYWDGDSWESVENVSNILDGNLWEPGYVDVAYLRITNAGTLALKYQLGVNIVSEKSGVNAEGESFKLSDYIYFDVVEGVNGETGAYETREAAMVNATETTKISAGYSKSGKLEAAAAPVYLALVVYMPTTVGNDANHDGVNVPQIDLGINIMATQLGAEEDSFGSDYDEKASVAVAPGESIAEAIKNAEDGGVVFLENGVHNVASGPIVVEGKNVTVVGLGEVIINKNYGGTHIFTVKNGANVTFENVTMDGKGNTREGIYVRWNSVVTLKNVTIKNTGGKDIMIDEASDAAHGEETASYVWLYNSHIEDVAMCASPVTSVAATQDTFVYFNYDASSSVGAIDVQSINLKPENIIINGVKSTEVGTTMQLYVSNDAELTAALETIKTNEAYWNKQVYVYMAAGEYSADHVINQYPKWNGIVGRGTGNNYQGGVPAGDPNTVITFVGETASTYSLRGAQTAPAVTFTGNVTVNGFADAQAGFPTATAVTTFENIAFANTAKTIDLTAAASNIFFSGCVFTGEYVTVGASGANRIGNVAFDGCTFNGTCISGYVDTLIDVKNSVVTDAPNGFINIQNSGDVNVENCTVNAGRYFVRTNGSNVDITVTDSDITVYESEGTKHLVYFRGSNESAEFTDCTIADGWTTAGVDANSTLEVYSFSEVDGLTLITDGVTDEVTLYLVPADYEGTTVTVPEGVDTIGGYAFAYNSNVEEIILSSTVTTLNDRAFRDTSASKVVLNEGLTNISYQAFRNALNVTEVVIPSTVTTISKEAFQNSGITTLSIPATVEILEYGACRDMKEVTSVIIEGDVEIPVYAFRACTKLISVTLKGTNVTFAGKGMIFTNKENGDGSAITVTVANEEIKARLLAADTAAKDYGGYKIVCAQTPNENGVYTDATTGKTYAYASDATTFGTAVSNGAGTVYLSSGNYIIPAAAKGKTLTIVGSGADTSVAVTKVGSGGENCDYGLDGSTVVFENITITTNSSTYIGYARCNATYNNCTINGTYTLYGNSEFNNCTFNVSGDVYNIWTWGAPEATFNNCTFNSDGKALLLYGTENTKLTLNDCIFNDNGGLTDLKAAVEIGNDYGKSYELIVNNTIVNGYEINDKGINTGSTLWGNKNSMGTDKLNVVVDGVDVY